MIDINLCDRQELSARILSREKTLVTVNAAEEAVGFHNASSSSNLRSSPQNFTKSIARLI
jgi:hypothetical protein